MQNENTQNQHDELIPFKNEAGQITQFKFMDDDLWADQDKLARMFGCSIQHISKQIIKLDEMGDLIENRTFKYLLKVQNEGGRTVTRKIKEYNTDIIISLAYGINSSNASYFRKWANQIIREKIREELEKRYNNYQPVQNISNFEMFNFLSSFIYLPIKTLSNITKTSADTFKYWCQKGKLEARKVLFEGVAGSFHWEIAVSSLKPDMQKKVFEYFDCQNKLKPLADLYQSVLSGDCDAITKAKLFFLNNNLITG